MPDKSTIERAIELAKGTSCRTVEDIRHQLAAENYSSINEHTAGHTIRAQLTALLKASR